MYVRMRIDHEGKTHLEQLLTFSDGKVTEKQWESIPIVGPGKSETWSMPLGFHAGVFFIEEEVSKYESDGKCSLYISTHVVPALSITKITPIGEEHVRIDTSERGKFFTIKVSIKDFVVTLTNLLSKFKIVTIKTNGNILQGEICEKEEKGNC